MRSELAKARQLLLSTIHCRPMKLGNRGPLVSFCFDDFPRTACTVGGAILKSFGARGTYYTAMGMMNTQNELGDQFTPDDLHCLWADGHELASHTFSHMSCRKVSLQTFENDVQQGRNALREITGCDPSNFAYPYGHVTLTAKKRMGTQMRSCRGIWGGVNGPTADLNLLRANELYGDLDRLADVEFLLSENEQRAGWLIFYTHDVRSSPSPFGCTPKLLEKAVSLVVKRGFSVAPVEEVLTGGAVLLASPGRGSCIPAGETSAGA